MSGEVIVTLGSFLLGAAFTAGALVWQQKGTVRDINGLGRKFGRTTALLVRWADTDKKRNQVADLIEGK